MSETDGPNVDVALDQAARRLGGSLRAPRRYGWRTKSAGAELVRSDGSHHWLRVQFADPQRFNRLRWHGEVDAAALTGVDKPILAEHFDWYDQNRLWRATLTTVAPNPAASPTADLRRPLTLSRDWLEALRRSLMTLATQKTTRLHCGQGPLDRTVGDRFGAGIATTVARWTVCHGDLHWANIGWPRPILFDWETWGRGPLGIDAAVLLVHSGLIPDAAAEVAALFADLLNTRDGRIAILYACARAFDHLERFDTLSPDLRGPTDALAKRTLAQLTAG